MSRPTTRPRRARSTRKKLSSFSPVRANTVKKSATGADVTQVLLPDSRQCAVLRSGPGRDRRSGRCRRPVRSCRSRRRAHLGARGRRAARAAPRRRKRCRNHVPINDCMLHTAATARLPHASSSTARHVGHTSAPLPRARGSASRRTRAPPPSAEELAGEARLSVEGGGLRPDLALGERWKRVANRPLLRRQCRSPRQLPSAMLVRVRVRLLLLELHRLRIDDHAVE